jgi:DNA polymerase I
VAAAVVGFELEDHDGKLVMGFASKTERFTLGDEPTTDLLNWLSSSDKKKVLFDLKGTKRILLANDLDIAGVIDDVLLLAYLLNPVRRNYYVDDIALEQLGLVIKRSDPNQLMPEAVSDPSLDAWLAISLAESMRAKVTGEGQLAVYEDIELPSSNTLALMETQGIAIDTVKLEELFNTLSCRGCEHSQAGIQDNRERD